MGPCGHNSTKQQQVMVGGRTVSSQGAAEAESGRGRAVEDAGGGEQAVGSVGIEGGEQGHGVTVAQSDSRQRLVSGGPGHNDKRAGGEQGRRV